MPFIPEDLEFALVCECCRTHPDSGEIRRLAGSSLNWDLLIEIASRHRVCSLVFWSLNQACPDLVPRRATNEFRARFQQDTKTNFVFTRELLAVLSLFGDAGIQAVPFKGAVLAWSLYDTPALRPASDIDLLLPEAAVERAIDLLAVRGYRIFPDADRRFFAGGGQVTLMRRSDAPVIDLHWRLSPRYLPGPDPHDFRQRLLTVEIEGQGVRTFCPEDLLLYTCAHGGKHGWTTLSMVCDLARVIDLCTLDWEATLRRAAQQRILRTVSIGLCLAKSLLRADVPESVLSQVDRRAAQMHGAARKQLENGPRVSLLKWRFQLLESPMDRLRFVLRIFEPSSADWQCLRLPAVLRPVYYVTRPVRLVWTWVLNRGDAA